MSDIFKCNARDGELRIDGAGQLWIAGVRVDDPQRRQTSLRLARSFICFGGGRVQVWAIRDRDEYIRRVELAGVVWWDVEESYETAEVGS